MSRAPVIHPLWLRMTHWINALAVLVMVTSGWKIYNASPIFHFSFPDGITFGGWLGGALLWHFFAMWVLIGNGLIYLGLNLASGRLKRKFFPISPRAVLTETLAAIKGKLSHANLSNYNQPQKLAYLFIIVDTLLLVLSGLAVWKSVQFPLLRELMGGYDNARIVHFAAMSALVAVVTIHVVMVALVPRTLLLMIRGR
ncbi:MAG: cytochrome b/b6 domain-containing protein [Sulfuriferula sp.]|nr:cytochrome b/b6 domain-containing protein [Sulfuriferula sp.]